MGQGHSPYLCPQAVVGGLLTPEDDHSLLISQFCEYLEYDDIRYHTMQVATSIMARATSQQPEVNSWVSSPPCVLPPQGGRQVAAARPAA